MRLTFLALLLATFAAHAENETRQIFRSTPRTLPGTGEVLKYISTDTGELDTNGATQLVTTLIKTLLDQDQQKNFSGRHDVFIIHTLVWNGVTDGKTALKIDKQHWYVLEINPKWGDDDFAKNNRLFGDRKVWFLYIHLNAPADFTYNVNYTLHATHKTPAYLVHLGQVLSIAIPPAKPAAATTVYWDAYQFNGIPVPCDMDISGEAVPTSGNAAPATIDKHTFDNEGRYHIDFSIGVPLVKLSELSYVSASNTLVPAKVQREKLFGLFNYYFQPVDIKASGFSWIPHPVAGVGLGSRPLQKALLGVGWGPTLANFYFGLLLNTQRQPENTSCGAQLPSPLPAGTVLKNKTCPQFGFGLNISAGSILDSLKKK